MEGGAPGRPPNEEVKASFGEERSEDGESQRRQSYCERRQSRFLLTCKSSLPIPSQKKTPKKSICPFSRCRPFTWLCIGFACIGCKDCRDVYLFSPQPSYTRSTATWP